MLQKITTRLARKSLNLLFKGRFRPLIAKNTIKIYGENICCYENNYTGNERKGKC